MRVTIMQVECDLCETASETFDMALHSMSDVLAELRTHGWVRWRRSCQDFCPDCAEKIRKATA